MVHSTDPGVSRCRGQKKEGLKVFQDEQRWNSRLRADSSGEKRELENGTGDFWSPKVSSFQGLLCLQSAMSGVTPEKKNNGAMPFLRRQ